MDNSLLEELLASVEQADEIIKKGAANSPCN